MPKQETDAPEQALATMVPAETPTFALDRPPIIDSIPERQVALLKDRAPGLTHSELAAGLELAWAYKLDPFAGEIWITKGKSRNTQPGKLLIMVGRDGLRKIAQRNGLGLDCDVVRENDRFEVMREADRTRTILHSYQGGPEQRGAIIGAWAECFEEATGKARGFFYAPVEEYRPSNANEFTPWAKQVSVMTLAAAERQAVRQATPLGGLLVEGEDALVNEAGEASEATPSAPFEGYPFEDEVMAVVERARALGHTGLASVATAQMALSGQPPEKVSEWLREADATLDALVEESLVDAEVVEDAPQPQGDALAQAEAGDQPTPEEAAVVAMRERVNELRQEAREVIANAEVVDDLIEEREAELLAEADSLEASADAAADPSQETLGL